MWKRTASSGGLVMWKETGGMVRVGNLATGEGLEGTSRGAVAAA